MAFSVITQIPVTNAGAKLQKKYCGREWLTADLADCYK